MLLPCRNGQVQQRISDIRDIVPICDAYAQEPESLSTATEQQHHTTQRSGEAIIGHHERRLSGSSQQTGAAISSSHTESSPQAVQVPVSTTPIPTTTGSLPARPVPGPVPTPTRTITTPPAQPSSGPPAPQSSRGQPSVQTPSAQDTTTRRSDATQNWAVQQRERNLEARRERDRILKQIESDKLARKARETERKTSAGDSTIAAPASSKRKATTTSNSARIQIRLLSGRTIRHTFPATATPATDLRPIVDAELANDTEGAHVPAYRLKLMGIPPDPTREIPLSEEQQSLAELGLLPSATLVITPIYGATEAYSGSAGWGILSLPVTIVGGAASMAIGAVGAVGGALSSTLGLGGSSSSADQPADANKPTTASSSARVRTIAEMRADGEKEDQQFYNGNQLNFEPDDQDEK
jgi:hypothetical protein